MSQSPSKQRKLSPEVGAPSTPSRIPAPRGTGRATTPVRNTPGGGPSASPSKAGASVSRPPAQVVEGDVGSQAEEGVEVPGIIGQAGQTGEVEATTPRGTRRTPRGGMTFAPRRRSQSPQKQDPKTSTPAGGNNEQNPFQKKGLKRSPISTADTAGGTDEQYPFQKKGGLRRSPIPETGAAEVVPQMGKTQEGPVVARPTTQSTTPQSIPPAPAVTAEIVDPFKKGGLRRSDVASPAPAVPAVPIEPTEPTDPFKKSGLRRSDIASPAPAAPAATVATVAPVAPVAPTEPTDPFKKGGLRRSGIASPAPAAPAASTAPPTEPTKPTNPFKKSGLRRSDVASPAAVVAAAPTEPTEPTNPFKKSGLRRSDVASPAPVAPTEPADPFKKGGLRRSNVAPTAPTNNTPAENAPTEETPTENTRTERAVTEETHPNTQSTAPLNAPVQESAPEPQPQPQSQPEPQVELEPEPELPPTPTQLGIPDPVVTTEPTGIHNTPSKRPKRPRSTTLKSSPLKPRDPLPTQPVPATVAATASSSASAPPLSAFPLKNKTKPTTTTTTATSEPPPKRRKSSPPPSRNLLPPDPHAAKKRRRAALLAEVAQLEADLVLAEAENARIRRHHEAGRRDVPAPKNEDAIFDLLLRATRPRVAGGGEERPRKKSVMINVGAFLPFAKKRRPVVSKEVVVKEGGLPSYGPVEVEDPMAYLSVFSPLGFTSTTTILASVGESGAVLQRRDVVAKARGGLFHARVGVVVDTASLAVVGVDVDGLDGNAEPEIGGWMRERAGEGMLGRDVNAVFYGMGQWVEGAAKRARFWCQIGEEFGCGGGKGKMKEKEKRSKGKGREGEDVELDEGVGAGKWTAKDLLPHMRRTALVLPVEDVEVTVEWRIALDWTGEAEHAISASARVPRGWHEQDERRSLTRLPEMFRKLVESRGPVVAVRTVVAGLLG
ncbi:hypothetical protein VC83_05304 [Pseudogymnoascus destructans]|uniref:Uncharacterized protein n=1 Tax=Pseudogymnoascus destructans TaxID=655981 RepID=A0A177A793_9PEZI|nr:uncharacterized protein VC83_05304 [Pseudogymnoascus destructans]OAF57996.1 hypothetical protein VC83_05304 [Pseudogymnoascus destructans]